MNRLWALIWTCTRETDTGTFSCSCRGDWRLFDTEITPFFFFLGGEGDCILVSILCYKQIAARHTHTTDGIAPSIRIGKKLKTFFIFLVANRSICRRMKKCCRVKWHVKECCLSSTLNGHNISTFLAIQERETNAKQNAWKSLGFFFLSSLRDTDRRGNDVTWTTLTSLYLLWDFRNQTPGEKGHTKATEFFSSFFLYLKSAF